MSEQDFNRYMERRSTNPEEAMSRLQEGELSEEERRERLFPNINMIISAHEKDLVPKVKQLLAKHNGNPKSVPEDEYEILGDSTLGCEGLMIRMIAERLSTKTA